MLAGGTVASGLTLWDSEEGGGHPPAGPGAINYGVVSQYGMDVL